MAPSPLQPALRGIAALLCVALACSGDTGLPQPECPAGMYALPSAGAGGNATRCVESLLCKGSFAEVPGESCNCKTADKSMKKCAECVFTGGSLGKLTAVKTCLRCRKGLYVSVAANGASACVAADACEPGFVPSSLGSGDRKCRTPFACKSKRVQSGPETGDKCKCQGSSCLACEWGTAGHTCTKCGDATYSFDRGCSGACPAQEAHVGVQKNGRFCHPAPVVCKGKAVRSPPEVRGLACKCPVGCKKCRYDPGNEPGEAVCLDDTTTTPEATTPSSSTMSSSSTTPSPVTSGTTTVDQSHCTPKTCRCRPDSYMKEFLNAQGCPSCVCLPGTSTPSPTTTTAPPTTGAPTQPQNVSCPPIELCDCGFGSYAHIWTRDVNDCATCNCKELNSPRLSADEVPDGGEAALELHSVARLWNEVLLRAIRNDFARPTVHARNLFHISSAIYDAWSVFDAAAAPWLLGRPGCSFDGKDVAWIDSNTTDADRVEAISFAAFRIILHRFVNSPGAKEIREDAHRLMKLLGLNAEYQVRDPKRPNAPMGNHIADCYIRYGQDDGANEKNDYANKVYQQANPPLRPELPGNPEIVDLDRWQPLMLATTIDQAGNVLDPDTYPCGRSLCRSLPFLGPEWGEVTPFSLRSEDATVRERDGFNYTVYHDPGAPPSIYGDEDERAMYHWTHSLVAAWSSHLDPDDGVTVDISPLSLGNISDFPSDMADYPDFYNTRDGGDASRGYTINPVTGKPYEPQIVPRGDYARVLAEFWADGPDSETPPGHWFVLMNEVFDHELLVRKYEGVGEVMSRLEWDVKGYFTLGGTMHDAAITAWSIKGYHDYTRPVSSLRAMADRGQSSDPEAPSYHEDGILLMPGLIELVKPGDKLAGDEGEHINKIKVKAWRGPSYIVNPNTDEAGVGWILVENWWPYQRPSFVTPPFAGFVSGHSTFSRAAAEVMTAFTGSAYFPGGLSGFEIKKNEFLVFERGPSVDMTLQWATYRDASDQCSLSRIWGGIHPPADDIPGRLIGEQVGTTAFAHAKAFFEGRA